MNRQRKVGISTPITMKIRCQQHPDPLRAENQEQLLLAMLWDWPVRLSGPRLPNRTARRRRTCSLASVR